jgi:phosphinothricin acetyltransferase
MASSDITVRPATPEDIPSVNAIHRHYVEQTVITFTTEANSDDEALANYNKVKDVGCPYLVATDHEGTVVGYSYVSGFRGVKPGYRHTLELSLFCHPDEVRKGIGKQLLTRMIEILEQPEKWEGWFDGTRLMDYQPEQLMAVMAVDIEGPGQGLRLRDWYLQLGFEERGMLKEVGWKKGRWIDTIYLQRSLRH